MKKLYIVFFFLAATPFLFAQEVASNLNNAKSSYKSGNLEDARFALQEALNSVNQTIGKEILALLPSKIGQMSVVAEGDDVTGANLGVAGLFVSRDYKAEGQNSSFEIVSDSPLLAGVSSLLTMSVFMAADPNQKRIKVDGYKALLTREESSEGVVSYNMQLPFGSSLLTFDCEGISSEDEVMGMINSLPVAEVIKVAQ